MNREEMTITIQVHPAIAILIVGSLNTRLDEVTDKGHETLHNIAQKISDQISDHVKVFGLPLDGINKIEEGREI